MLRKKRNSVPWEICDYDSDEELAVEVFDYNVKTCCIYDNGGNVLAPVQVKRPDRSFQRPADRLHRAVWSDDPAKVQRLVISEGLFVDSWNCLGQTPLFVASYTRKLAMVNMLLNLGADPNVICVGGYTATHGACYSASRRILAMILKFGGDLSIHDVHRTTPIDWIEWQPDEKRRIRILDFVESVRKITLRKSSSLSRSSRSSSSSLPANEETGRALRLHHSRLQSHSLKNLSPQHHRSHHEHYECSNLDAKQSLSHHTFTRRLLSEQQRARSNLEHYDVEKNLSSDSDASNRDLQQWQTITQPSLDYPDHAKSSSSSRNKHRAANGVDVKAKAFRDSSSPNSTDLSLPRSYRRPNQRYFTAMESSGPEVPPLRSTIAKVRDLHISDRDRKKSNERKASGGGQAATTASSQLYPYKFGCATLPTKLKQAQNGKLGAFKQASTSQLLPKSVSKSATNVRKLSAQRQVSAPQIGQQLPEELRQVYQKIKGGQKVVVPKDAKKSFGLNNVLEKPDVSPRPSPTLRKDAIKPASHFSEFRGYEKAVPRQLCAPNADHSPRSQDGDKTEFRTIPEMSSMTDDDFKNMTENSSAFNTEPPMNAGFLRPVPPKFQRPTTLPHGDIYLPRVPQPQNGPRYASTPKDGPAYRTAKLRQDFLNDNKNSSFVALMNQNKVNTADVAQDFDNGAVITSSPVTKTAPVSFPPPMNAGGVNVNAWEGQRKQPVVLSSSNAEYEFYSNQKNPNMEPQQFEQEYFSTVAPVDVDEAINNDKSASDPPSQMWATVESGTAIEGEEGWNPVNNFDADVPQGDYVAEPQNDWPAEEENEPAPNDAELNDWGATPQADADANGQSKQEENDWATVNEPQASEYDQNGGEAGGFQTLPAWGDDQGEDDQAQIEAEATEPAGEEWQEQSEYATATGDTLDPKPSTDNDRNEDTGNFVTMPVNDPQETNDDYHQEELDQISQVDGASEWINKSFGQPYSSPSRKFGSPRKFHSLDLNLNTDGAGSISGVSEFSNLSNTWKQIALMKHKPSWMYSSAWSRRTSDASFISGAQEIEDLYCDDEIDQNLENDPNMMLSAYYQNMAASNNNDVHFPERPCLTDRDSVLSMDIPSTGPTSLRSEMGDDMEPIQEVNGR